VVVLGDKGVGKTCLVLRFIEGYFAPSQPSTIGAFFLTKKFTTPEGVQCKMQIVRNLAVLSPALPGITVHRGRFRDQKFTTPEGVQCKMQIVREPVYVSCGMGLCGIMMTRGRLP
jgi:GTPase SAR1 family protein